jgi:hypothetical protein
MIALASPSSCCPCNPGLSGGVAFSSNLSSFVKEIHVCFDLPFVRQINKFHSTSAILFESLLQAIRPSVSIQVWVR